jgi:hypothetical protein
MKYVFRRALVGIIIIPVVAMVWVLFSAILGMVFALPMSSVNRVWNDGLWLGLLATIMFAIIPLLNGKRR